MYVLIMCTTVARNIAWNSSGYLLS